MRLERKGNRVKGSEWIMKIGFNKNSQVWALLLYTNLHWVALHCYALFYATAFYHLIFSTSLFQLICAHLICDPVEAMWLSSTSWMILFIARQSAGRPERNSLKMKLCLEIKYETNPKIAMSLDYLQLLNIYRKSDGYIFWRNRSWAYSIHWLNKRQYER